MDPDDGGSEVGGAGGRGPARAPSSSALSELLDGLRRRRSGGEAGGGDGAGSAVSLPVYQTTAASTLRRRASAASLSASADGDHVEPRPGILKPSSPLLPRRSAAEASPRYSSGDSLSSVPSLPRLSSLAARHTLSIPEEDGEDGGRPLKRSPQPPRRCMLGSLASEDGGGGGELGSEPMVFQNRRLAGDSDAASDILPAIRRAQSACSVASSVRGRRALSVHFGELPPSTRSRKSSESSSSSSSSSSASGGGGGGQGAGPRLRYERPQGERLEAEGSEGGDVASVMKRYLKKEVD